MPAHEYKEDSVFFAENDEQPCIHFVFEQLATKMPGNIAVVFKEKKISYKELNEAANKLAAYLITNRGVKPDDLVGIMLHRSEYMMIGILAILKAGGAYVPIDPYNNPERTAFIIADAGLKTILFDGQMVSPQIVPGVGLLNITDPQYYYGDGKNVSNDTTGANLAYAIYTSGSTGVPKGVLIRHCSLMNSINCFIEQYQITPDYVFLQSAPFFFDASIMELLFPLASGSSVVFLEPSAHKYPEKVIHAIEENAVSILFFTTAFLQSLLDYIAAVNYDVRRLKTVKRVVAGGDVLSVKLANFFNRIFFSKTGIGLTNIYGPSEATVWVTAWNCESHEELHLVPIGKPIPNSEVYILDEQLNAVKPGEAGELAIGGTPVAKGYLNRPELDAEKFVENPFVYGEKMYRTGDKARYLSDGNIEFLGRMDNQVKINGLRIELGEIENAILKNEAVKECLVLMKEISGTRELVAYITLTDERMDVAKVTDELVAALNLYLPKYMIPGFYLKLNNFSRTSNGKIDRKNLPLPAGRYHKMQQPYAAPVTEAEKKLTVIFESNLTINNIGVNEPIFNLGVKSLMVTKILIEIRNCLKSSISISQFFQLQTIRDIAAFIENAVVQNTNPFALIKPGNGVPLFLLPGAYGIPLDFSNFAASYTGSQPLFSISFRSHDSSSTIKGFQFFDSLNDYASYLTTQIKIIQPDGPYNLAGYSFGGTLAFEIATQLQKEEKKIGLLLSIAAAPPQHLKSLRMRWSKLNELYIIANLNYKLKKTYFKHRFPHLLNRKLNKHFSFTNNRMLPEAGDKIAYNELNKLLEDFSKLHNVYQNGLPSAKFQGDLVLVYEDLDRSTFANFEWQFYYRTALLPKLWKKKIAGKILTYRINCTHSELLHEPFVNKISAIAKSYFDNEVRMNILSD